MSTERIPRQVVGALYVESSVNIRTKGVPPRRPYRNFATILRKTSQYVELKAKVAVAVSRMHGFKKTPDKPLGKFLEQRKKDKETAPARKAALAEYARRLK